LAIPGWLKAGGRELGSESPAYEAIHAEGSIEIGKFSIKQAGEPMRLVDYKSHVSVGLYNLEAVAQSGMDGIHQADFPFHAVLPSYFNHTKPGFVSGLITRA
jgi:hypothetical protein